jgi:hypothetical protein
MGLGLGEMTTVVLVASAPEDGERRREIYLALVGRCEGRCRFHRLGIGTPGRN